MRASFDADITRFNGFINELLRMADKPGVTFRDVLEGQTGKVLEICVKRTPEAKLEEALTASGKRVARRFNTYAYEGPGKDAQGVYPRISVTKTGVWWLDESHGIGKGRSYYMMQGPGRWTDNRGSRSAPGGARWSDARWAQFSAMNEMRLEERGQEIKKVHGDISHAIGLTKQSWLQIADDIGIEIKVPPHVRAAKPTTGKKYQNGSGDWFASGNSLFVEIRNSMPILLNKQKGEKILHGAIRTRLKAFDKEIETGVFDDIKTRAQRYPGIFVNYSTSGRAWKDKKGRKKKTS